MDERFEPAKGINRNVELTRKRTHSYTKEAAIIIKLDDSESVYIVNYNQVTDAPISSHIFLRKIFLNLTLN